MKRLSVFAALVLAFLAALAPLIAGGRKDTDTNAKEITLNKHQLAALAVAIREMQRRGLPFRAYQVVITDAGKSYSVAFMEDPLDLRYTGGKGMEWRVRKRDLKLFGPTLYR